ncbi:unnamed protein product [Cuscuta campestris]|uniref:SWIM-type domain-containing protein n=1 Tax=Cuscuta campestris TaxID=132261 RepID=A0A484MK46_9ASTE|nr:unnamed protein product [Cuscuta campestris]
MCKKGLDTLFEKLANAYTKRSFKRLYGDLKARYPAAGNYIDNIPKKRWARAYFEINRYQIMTTNGAESINSVLREDRELPIVALLKAVQNMTSRWRGKRQQELRSLDASNPPVTLAVEAEMRKRFNTALRLECHQLNQYEFEVKGVHSDHVVNLSNKTCTCQVFDKDMIPCVHALACSERTCIDCYSLCSKLYTKDYMYIAYAETIYPVPHEDDWDADGMELLEVKPPILNKQRGRPTTKRFPSDGEARKKYKLTCSGCQGKGHTVRTCAKRPRKDTSTTNDLNNTDCM